MSPRGVRVWSLVLVILCAFLPLAYSEPSVGEQAGTFQVEPVQIQKALAQAGFYQGSIDGIIGARTRASIMAFQQANGLAADGICGPRTWNKLKEYLPQSEEEAPFLTQGPESKAGLTHQSPQVSSASQPAGGELKQKLIS